MNVIITRYGGTVTDVLTTTVYSFLPNVSRLRENGNTCHSRNIVLCSELVTKRWTKFTSPVI